MDPAATRILAAVVSPGSNSQVGMGDSSLGHDLAMGAARARACGPRAPAGQPLAKPVIRCPGPRRAGPLLGGGASSARRTAWVSQVLTETPSFAAAASIR